MSELILSALLRQAALLSAGVVLLLALRPLLLRRLGASASYAAWLLLPALLLTPALPRPVQEPLRVALAASGSAALATLAQPFKAPGPRSATLALALWLAGAGAVMALQARRQRRLSRVASRLPAGSSPALVGLLRPRLLLPLDFEQRFSADEQALVLAHEAVHQARFDNAWNALACALTALHWWNPLAWLAWRRMQADQELACDAAVLATHPGALPIYTRALLAAHGLVTHDAPLASRWVSAHPLVERIAMLPQPQAPRARRAALLTLLIAAVSGLSYAAQADAPKPDSQPPQKVEIRLNLQTGGVTSTPRLITALGVRSRIEWGNAPSEIWRLDLTVTQADDGRLRVVTLPSYAGQTLGSNTALLTTGQNFGQRIGGTGGVPLLEMTQVVSLLPADFQMPAKPAVKPPQ